MTETTPGPGAARGPKIRPTDREKPRGPRDGEPLKEAPAGAGLEKSPGTAAESKALQLEASATRTLTQGAAKTLAEARAQWDTCITELRALQEQAGEAVQRGRELGAAVGQMERDVERLGNQQSLIMRRLTAALTDDDTGEKRKRIAEDFKVAMQIGYWPGVVEVVRESVEAAHAEIKEMVLHPVTWIRWLLYAGCVALGLWGLAILALAIRGGVALTG